MIKNKELKYKCMIASWRYCLPYNEETKHLIGTTDNYETI